MATLSPIASVVFAGFAFSFTEKRRTLFPVKVSPFTLFALIILLVPFVK
jgi:hypothetical protein